MFVHDTVAAVFDCGQRQHRGRPDEFTVRSRVPEKRHRKHAQAQPSRDQRSDRRGGAHTQRHPLFQSVQQRANPVQATRPKRERTKRTSQYGLRNRVSPHQCRAQITKQKTNCLDRDKNKFTLEFV